MHRKKRSSRNLDGFIQRRRVGSIGDFKNTLPIIDAAKRRASADNINRAAGFGEEDPTNYDIIEHAIGANKIMKPERKSRRSEGKTYNPVRRFWRWRKARRLRLKEKRAQETKRRKYLRRLLKLILLVAVGAVAFFTLRTYLTLNSIIVRDGEGSVAVCSTPEPEQLKTEGDARINILMVGIGGPGHDGGDLADTIILASMDPINHTMTLFSIPRDFYVNVPGYGQTKINAAHAYGEQEARGQGRGVKLLQKTIEQTLAVDIHYYVRVDFKAFMQAVDTVGGVKINVTNPVVNDYNFAWMLDGQALNIHKGPQTLDGLHALLFARSRYTSPRGDFDRNDRQRQILVALKKQILSAGTYSDPRKINGLISAVGTHVRTNIGLDEMRCMYDNISQIENKNIISKGLDNSANNYLVGANVNGASVQQPKSGNYLAIRNYVRKLFVDGFISSEAALVDVYNGANQASLATKNAATLKSYGYNIGTVDDAPKGSYPETIIYDMGGDDKPYTKHYLESRYGVEVRSGDDLPEGITTTAKFVIVLGDNAK